VEKTNYIIKDEKTVPAEDYSFLRRKGLEHIEKLSSAIWTDYNIHDPGITILEMLCYAITDISYRTSFDIKDLLTTPKDQGGIKELYTARQILSCNPVTVNDLRKVLVDVEGIRNAWIKIAEKQEQDLYINCKKSLLTFEKKSGYRELKMDGLYDIVLELDDDLLLGDLNDYSFQEVYKEDDKTISYTFSFPAWDYFFSRKTNPEDWEFDSYIYSQYISANKVHEADIILTTGSQTITLPVIFVIDGKRNLDNENKIKDFLATGGVHTLFENYLKKVTAAIKIVKETVTRIHKHRNLCEDFKSFKAIDIEEIALCATIEVSPDAEIEKVYARILFQVGNFLAPEILFCSLDDLLNEKTTVERIFEGPSLDHGFIRENDLNKSELLKEIHVSDIINIIMDIEGVLAINKIQIGSSHNGVRINAGEKWVLVPGEGRAPRLRPEMADLTFYKGLIPYDIFDVEKIDLYYQELVQSVRTSKLKKDEYDFPVPEGKYSDVSDYISVQEEFPLVYGIGSKGIPGLVDEKRKAQAKQLKAFLTLYDQLLANYLAQLSHLKDILSFREDIDRTYFFQLPYPVPDADADTIQHMKDGIPEIYKLLDKFTATLGSSVDIDDYKSYEALWEIFAKDEDNAFVKGLASYAEDKDIFEQRRNRFLDHLMSRFAEQFTDYVLLMYQMDGPKAAAELIIDKCEFLADYVEISSSRGKAYNYNICDNLWTTDIEKGSNISGYEKRLARMTGVADYSRRSLVSDDPDIIETEGFHLIEHILLRPKNETYEPLPVCIDPDCRSCPGFLDPYSFRLTIILPAWVGRFTDMNFRRYFENTARLEAPAHIHVKICWISRDNMKIFEAAYRDWLYALCKDEMTPEIQNKLVAILTQIKSVYPEGELHDCAADKNENPIILGITSIGSSKTE